jgi:hypothetical protein
MSSTSQPNSQHLVSWQSAFWAVAAIFANAFVQNVGFFGELPDNALVLASLRSSPLVCVMDTILTLLETIRLRVRGKPLKRAIDEVWKIRFSDPEEHEAAGIDRRWIVNMIIAALSFTQVVKVFSMRGIVVTQTLVMIYFISFTVPEVYRVISGTCEPSLSLATKDKKRKGRSVSSFLVLLSTILQSGCWIWVICKVLPDRWFIKTNPDPMYIFNRLNTFIAQVLTSSGPFLLFLGGVAFWSYYVQPKRSSRGWTVDIIGFPERCIDDIRNQMKVLEGMYAARRISRTALVDLNLIIFFRDVIERFLMASICSYFCWMFGSFTSMVMPVQSEPWVDFPKFVLAILLILVSLPLSFICYNTLLMLGGKHLMGKATLLDFLGLTFLTYNLITVVVYYRYIYSPEFTFKPSWTEVMG